MSFHEPDPTRSGFFFIDRRTMDKARELTFSAMNRKF